MLRIGIIVVIWLTAGLFAQDIEDKTQDSYRIETVREGNGPKEIRFISPDGDIVKVLPVKKVEYLKSKEPGKEIMNWSEVLVSQNSRFALQIECSELVDAEYKMAISNDSNLRFSYINAEGKVLWRKNFVVWHEGPGWMTYGYKISHNGESILFFRSKELDYIEFETEIYVFDTLGNKLTQVTYNSLIEGNEISPDGKIVGVVVFKDKDGKIGRHLFFLDVETGRTKVVKARGERWKGSFVLSSSTEPPESGKVRLIWQPYGEEYQVPGGGLKMKDILFDSLPDDLSTLLDKEESKERSKIELIPVYEKTFEDTIVDVIFDEAEMTIKEAKTAGWKQKVFTNEEKIEGKATVPYPEVVFVPREVVHPVYHDIKEINFLYKNGELRKKISIDSNNERVITSPCKKFIVIKRIPAEYGLNIQGGILYRSDGEEVWRKDEGPFPVAVNDEGYVVANYFDWMYDPYDFVIYNPQGQEIVRIADPLEEVREKWFSAQFSKDGNYIVVRYTDTRSKSLIILLTKEGKIVWKKDFNYLAHVYKIHSGIGIWGESFKGFQVYIFFLDWDGQLKWKTQVKLFGWTHLKVSQDNQKVFAISSTGTACCFDISTGEILWIHKEDWTPDYKSRRCPSNVPEFIEIDVLDNRMFVIGKYTDKDLQWYGSSFFVFNSEDGTLIQKIDYPNKRITLFSHNNKIFLLDIDAGKIVSLRIEE
ncbi:MAG: hypothetical protein E3J70_07720 [Candidatus Heimdallarchaeota archaeon]|nr:MAG: hypothetical protein E3J70_07720 [Candidatus Heimdallarchaeota archaeon]